MYLLGVLASLICSGGFILIFWSSYRIKNKDEKVFDCMRKKVLAFLIAVFIFRSAFGVSIFNHALFFTLVIFIKYSQREQRELKVNDENNAFNF
jgi:hypothetical protein